MIIEGEGIEAVNCSTNLKTWPYERNGNRYYPKGTIYFREDCTVHDNQENCLAAKWTHCRLPDRRPDLHLGECDCETCVPFLASIGFTNWTAGSEYCRWDDYD